MTKPVLVTSAAGGRQGKTGRHVSEMLLKRGVPVRAFVHTIDERSEHLRALGAEIMQGDFLDIRVVQRAAKRCRKTACHRERGGSIGELGHAVANIAEIAGLEIEHRRQAGQVSLILNSLMAASRCSRASGSAARRPCCGGHGCRSSPTSRS